MAARFISLPADTSRSAAIRARRCLLACSAAALACPGTIVLGQSGQRVYRIGVLSQRWLDEQPDEGFRWQEFVAELGRRGYTEGRNVVFVKRVAPVQQSALLEQRALELIRTGVDVIYVQGSTQAALAARRVASNTPIVFYSSADPVGMGLVASLAQPGGNLTGSSIQTWATLPRAIQLLAQASATLTTLAFLQRPGVRTQPWYRPYVDAATAAAESIHCGVRFIDIDAADSDLQALPRILARDRVDGVSVLAGVPDTLRTRLPALLIKARIPSLGDPESGFLMSYGYSSAALAQTAARHVAQVLGGQRAGDIPVEQISTFDLVINLKTAKALGLSIPTSVLIQATRLIE